MLFVLPILNRSAHYNNLQKQEEEEEKLKKSSTANNNNNVNENRNSTNTNLFNNANDPSVKSRKSSENTNQTTRNPSIEIIAKPLHPLSNKAAEKRPIDVKGTNSANFKSNTSQAKTFARKVSNLPNIVPKHLVSTSPNERPLKCLETLAQKAGITFDESFDTNRIAPQSIRSTPHKMDKNQAQAQQVAAQQMPIQISSEQLQQLQQQYQLQQAFAASGGASIQVKQEFPQQTITAEQLNKQLQEQHQVQQMQLIDPTAAGSQHQAANGATMGIKYVSSMYLME